jgi:hypothetical protein
VLAGGRGRIPSRGRSPSREGGAGLAERWAATGVRALPGGGRAHRSPREGPRPRPGCRLGGGGFGGGRLRRGRVGRSQPPESLGPGWAGPALVVRLERWGASRRRRGPRFWGRSGSWRAGPALVVRVGAVGADPSTRRGTCLRLARAGSAGTIRVDAARRSRAANGRRTDPSASRGSGVGSRQPRRPPDSPYEPRHQGRNGGAGGPAPPGVRVGKPNRRRTGVGRPASPGAPAPSTAAAWWVVRRRRRSRCR